MKLAPIFSLFLFSLASGESSVLLILGQEGLHRTVLNKENGSLSSPELIEQYSTGSWVVSHPTLPIVYTSWRDGDKMGFAAITVDKDGNSQGIETLDLGVPGLSHIAISPDGRLLAAALWSGKSTVLASLNEDGSPGELLQVFEHEGSGPGFRQEQPRPHWSGFNGDGSVLHSTDLGTDEIWSFDVVEGEPAGIELKHTHEFPKGFGVRHLAFHPTKKFAYASQELGSRITAMTYDETASRFTTIAHYETLPAGSDEVFNNTSEIIVHPSGNWVYIGNRGNDTIGVWAIDQATGDITWVENEAIRGFWPRNFNLTDDGEWLIALGQRSHTASLFRVNQETGELISAQEMILIRNPTRVLEWSR